LAERARATNHVIDAAVSAPVKGPLDQMSATTDPHADRHVIAIRLQRCPVPAKYTFDAPVTATHTISNFRPSRPPQRKTADVAALNFFSGELRFSARES
jgi:hypothetical protein